MNRTLGLTNLFPKLSFEFKRWTWMLMKHAINILHWLQLLRCVAIFVLLMLCIWHYRNELHLHLYFNYQLNWLKFEKCNLLQLNSVVVYFIELCQITQQTWLWIDKFVMSQKYKVMAYRPSSVEVHLRRTRSYGDREVVRCPSQNHNPTTSTA